MLNVVAYNFNTDIGNTYTPCANNCGYEWLKPFADIMTNHYVEHISSYQPPDMFDRVMMGIIRK